MAQEHAGGPGSLEQESADLGSEPEETDSTFSTEDAEDSPREKPLAAEDYGVTGAEEAREEPLSERLRREVRDILAGRRPVDPDRLRASGFAGRVVDDDGAFLADTDTGGYSAEEAAMHLLVPPRSAKRVKAGTHADRLDLLEAQVAVLLTMGRIHTEALALLTDALQRLPTEEPDEEARKVSRAARDAHELLLPLRDLAR